MNKTDLLFIGGFLGAGKTTLLWRIAGRLAEQGLSVGLITNDQAPDLVDTVLLTESRRRIREVAGRCFCCGFDALIDAARALNREMPADVLVAEPVGSCTDLSATILQPLKDRYRGEFVLRPLSVLVDPARLADALSDPPKHMHRDAAYIYRKQLDEADTIVLNKIDQLDATGRDALVQRVMRAFPDRAVHCISALNGEGVDEWLGSTLSETQAGRHLANVDYDTYASGEAVLGWLNGKYELRHHGHAPEWQVFCRTLMERIRQSLVDAELNTGHVKILLSTTAGRYIANLTRTDEQVSIRGHMPDAPATALLLVNARVEVAPPQLEAIVAAAMKAAAGDVVRYTTQELRSLQPGRPRPTVRYDRVV